MSQLFRLPQAIKHDPAIDAWMHWEKGARGELAKHWFEVIRELLHDGHPTACVADAAFAYVDTFTAHVNVGFFRGAELDDPHGLLEGTGKLMRHVKIRPGTALDAVALAKLINAAYADMKKRVRAGQKASGV
jgi:hypothetical protein